MPFLFGNFYNKSVYNSMIYLVDGANTFDVTVTENTISPSTAQYLFVFENDNTGKKVACTSTNTSTNTDRYDRFVITVGTDVPLTGNIKLDDYGFYHYYIYERTAAQIAAFSYSTIDTTDLDTLGATVEIGKMKYKLVEADETGAYNLRTSIKTYGR